MNDALAGNAIRVERPTKTLRELALDKVRDAIVDGYFRPGDRLVERDLWCATRCQSYQSSVRCCGTSNPRASRELA